MGLLLVVRPLTPAFALALLVLAFCLLLYRRLLLDITSAAFILAVRPEEVIIETLLCCLLLCLVLLCPLTHLLLAFLFLLAHLPLVLLQRRLVLLVPGRAQPRSERNLHVDVLVVSLALAPAFRHHVIPTAEKEGA